MNWRKKKVYGSYKKTTCPFCNRTATKKNEQGLDVCHLHTKSVLQEMKCLCGSWLDLKVGKFGPYFNCIKCGNMNYNKAMEIGSSTKTVGEVKTETSEKTIQKNRKLHLSKLRILTTLTKSQKQIAKIIGSWQPNVSRLIQGKHLPTVEQLRELLQHSTTNNLKDNILKKCMTN